MSPRRRFVLWGALALTLAAVFAVDRDEEGGTVPPVARPARRGASVGGERPAEPAPPTAREDLARPAYAAGGGDLFPARHWRPPAAAAVAPGGPPPLPFAYLGRTLAGREPLVFLLYQERTLVVRRGEVIDGIYRVERIAPHSMTLVYLPLKQEQALAFGSADR